MAARGDIRAVPFDVTGKKALIVGMGASGVAAALFLKDLGAIVTVTDRAAVPDAAGEVERLQAKGITLELGGHSL